MLDGTNLMVCSFNIDNKLSIIKTIDKSRFEPGSHL